MNQLMNIIQKAATYEYHQAYRKLSKAYVDLNTMIVSGVPNVRDFDKPTDIKEVIDVCTAIVDKTTQAIDAALIYIADLTCFTVSASRPILFLVDKLNPSLLSEGSYWVCEHTFGVRDVTNTVDITDLAVNLIEDPKLCEMFGDDIDCKIIPAKHRDDIKLYPEDRVLFVDYPYVKLYRITSSENEEHANELTKIDAEHASPEDLMIATKYLWWTNDMTSKIGVNPNNFDEITVIPNEMTVERLIDKYEEAINKTTYDFDHIVNTFEHLIREDYKPSMEESAMNIGRIEDLLNAIFEGRLNPDSTDSDNEKEDYDE